MANYIIATELCETTLEEEGIIRVHCHLMLDAGLVVNSQFKIRSYWLYAGSLTIKIVGSNRYKLAQVCPTL